MRACFRCAECTIQVRAHDDLLLVAGMRVSQRARLIDAGITTDRTSWPPTTARCPNCRAGPSRALTAQARLQIAPTRRRQAAVRDRRPAAADGAARRRTRATCSSTSRATRCGRPTAASGAWSTCSGVLDVADEFRPFWAHDRAERAPGARRLPRPWCASGASAIPACTSTTTPPTRRARCCGWPAATASARTRSTTCCATASSSTFIRWCARAFGSAPRTTASSRSSRSTWATSCAAARSPRPTDSITQYARYCELRDEGRADEAAIVLKEIEEYNRYDCRSTRRLRDWLMARAIECGRAAASAPQPVDATAAPSRSTTTSHAR